MALHNLALQHMSGQGCAPDMALAANLFRQAADKGFTYSQVGCVCE